jgi:hypothetical protein
LLEVGGGSEVSRAVQKALTTPTGLLGLLTYQ